MSSSQQPSGREADNALPKIINELMASCKSPDMIVKLFFRRYKYDIITRKYRFYSDFSFIGAAVHRPRRWFARTINKSRSICREAVTTLSLLPATSCHSIGTSATGMPSCLAKSKSSTSNIQVGRCCAGNIC